jgi:hypothetical protein
MASPLSMRPIGTPNPTASIVERRNSLTRLPPVFLKSVQLLHSGDDDALPALLDLVRKTTPSSTAAAPAPLPRPPASSAPLPARPPPPLPASELPRSSHGTTAPAGAPLPKLPPLPLIPTSKRPERPGAEESSLRSPADSPAKKLKTLGVGSSNGASTSSDAAK